MKILIVSDAWHPQINGVVRTYEHLSAELTRRGHSVEVIGPADFPHHFAVPFYKEIELTPFPRRILEHRIGDFAPDHIHIGVEGPLGWAAREIAIERGYRFTTCYHTHFPDYLSQRLPRALSRLQPPLNASIYRLLAKFHSAAHTTFVVSDLLGEHLRENGFTSPMAPMTRGINSEIFYAGEKTKFRDLNGPIALYVGRVSHEKNIEAFLSAKWEGSKVVVGDGPSLPSLKSRFSEVVFTGVMRGQELGDCYRSADLFVFPSKTDTFGMVNIEALACGLPVAAYPEMGPSAIITAPELGCLNENLEIAMKNALSCAGDAEFRQNHAKTVYSWEKAATQFLSALPNYG